MEVHPPEHPIHTWREFFIHMGTITLGLLIAIGLEQSVEWMHRRHERHQLHQDLIEETEANRHRIEVDIQENERMYRLFVAAYRGVKSGAPAQGVLRITLPVSVPHPNLDEVVAPSQTVWDTAKAAGTIRLLPSEEAQVFSRMNYEAERSFDAHDRAGDALRRASVVLDRYDIHPEAGQTFSLPVDARNEVLEALGMSQENLENTLYWLGAYLGACEAVLHHAESVDDMFPYMDRETKKISAEIAAH